MQSRTLDLNVPVTQGRQPECLVFGGGFLITDANAGSVDETDYGGEHLLSRHAGQGELPAHGFAYIGECVDDAGQVFEFSLISDGSISSVVAILFAPASIVADGLQMPGLDRADPHTLPCGRNREGTDALNVSRVFQATTGAIKVSESPAATSPAEAGSLVPQILKSGRCR
jgi:hypothetical protein